MAFDSTQWRIAAAASRVETHLGRTSFLLEDGLVTLRDVAATDGRLELAIAFPRGRAFVGALWRVRDDRNFEAFFLRPHQSGNPDATQYTPVFNGVWGWQLYHGPRYMVALEHAFDEWTRLSVEFAGERARVWVGEGAEPVLVVDGLKHPVGPGGVGLYASGAAHFADVSFVPLGESAPVPTKRPEVPAGVISAWQVSEAFDEALLPIHGAPVLEGRSWTLLRAEPSGLADLARVQGLEGGDTALARAVILAEREGVRQLELGFSDRVRAYLNGVPVFRGDDGYRSRDYRFLGSIGYFDALYLPLREGANELVLAISEDFGGWGVQARFPDPEGLTLS